MKLINDNKSWKFKCFILFYQLNFFFLNTSIFTNIKATSYSPKVYIKWSSINIVSKYSRYKPCKRFSNCISLKASVKEAFLFLLQNEIFIYEIHKILQFRDIQVRIFRSTFIHFGISNGELVMKIHV